MTFFESMNESHSRLVGSSLQVNADVGDLAKGWIVSAAVDPDRERVQAVLSSLDPRIATFQ